MIQANELRIGNLVLDGNGEITTVESIVDGAINYSLDYGALWTDEEYCFENLNPIPITEEWLFKFGFVFDDVAEYFTEEKVYIKYYNEFGIKIDIEGLFYNGIYRQKLQYVHQLQNLYFALTQKEL